MAAIYQWIVDTEVIVTTTPYPIESLEYLAVTANLQGFAMFDIAYDKLDMTQDLVAVELRVLLKAYGPELDQLDVTQDLLGIELRQLLKSYGPEQDKLDVTQDLVAVTLVEKLIRTQVLPHGLDLAPALVTLNMEDV